MSSTCDCLVITRDLYDGKYYCNVCDREYKIKEVKYDKPIKIIAKDKLA
jgi:uncharacterized Zn finger protein (UPF0148 family)